MEGPSLFLAREQLRPFKGQRIVCPSGNTKAFDPSVLEGLVVKDIFAWGKHLVFQLPDFALRFHFLMFGTFEAQVGTEWVTGDYRRARSPRLALEFESGRFLAFSCSIKVLPKRHAKQLYDFTTDIMSPKWDETKVRRLLREQAGEEIGDALLDQDVFTGVGNIIKNEVLGLVRIRPTHKTGDLSAKEIRAIVAETRRFSRQFYRWRKAFVLRKNLRTYRKTVCQFCGGRLRRAKTGKRSRWSYWCPKDQH